MSAKPIALQEIPAASTEGKNLLNGNFDLIKELKVKVSAQVGEVDLTVGELFALKEHSVLTLKSQTTDPLHLMLDGKAVARGELVVVGDNFGIRITEIQRDSRA